MAKYGKKAGKKVEQAMRERKRGTLKSGSGKKVTSKKQAIAIGLSQAREEGGKVPAQKGSKKGSTKGSKKRGSKKGSTKKRSTKKRSSKKRSSKK